MKAAVSLGSLTPNHRIDIETIVRSTGVFSETEVAVALEVFDAAGSDDYEFVGAFADDRLVGYACFGPTPSTDRTFDLYWIAVRRDAQAGGIGGRLMDEVEHRLGQRDARMVVIETSSRPDYAPTRKFYDRRGYQESARLRDFYAVGDDRVVLTKRIDVADANAGTPPSPTPEYE